MSWVQFCNSLTNRWQCLSLGLEWKQTMDRAKHFHKMSWVYFSFNKTYLLKFILWWILTIWWILTNEYSCVICITIKLQNISFSLKSFLKTCLQSTLSPPIPTSGKNWFSCATRILPFLESFINSTKQYVVSSVCLYSHSIMLLRFIYVGLCISSSLIFNHWVLL